MRKNFLYLFYAVTSVFIFLALNQDLMLVVRNNSATEPQYVFTQKVDEDEEKRKQEELEMLRNWAENYDPKNVRQ